MMIAQQIQQLDKHDFVEYIHQLQLLAKKKFSFDIFIENRLSQNNKFEEHTTNSALDNLLKYKGILKGIDLSDITEEELYLQED